MVDTVMCFFKDSCMKKCIRGILFPLMKSENSQQNDCEFWDEAVWLCTKAEVDLCKAEEMRNQKLQNSVRLPKRACKPGKTSLNPSCVLIRNERLHSILWIAQCFWWNAKVELLWDQSSPVRSEMSCGLLYCSVHELHSLSEGRRWNKSFPYVIWCGASSISIRKVSMGVSPINLKKKRCSRHFRPMERRAGSRSNSLANLSVKQWMSVLGWAQCNTSAVFL